ncbi:MAG TPA: MFS transporter [Opitutaceae bacterium]|nr:MFS transporter [Opitutaceae bacterium]
MTPPPPARDEGLSTREYVGYALGDTASNLFFKTFGFFLTYYYVDVWGLGAAAVANMFLLVRVWDAINDPIMGMIADRTRSRWGKFRPYLLWMALPYGVAGYLIFANPDLGPGGKLIYAALTYNFMMMAYTAINVPYSSLLGVISPSSGTRTVASSFRFAGAFGGGLLVTLLVRPLVRDLGGGDEVKGFQYTMAIFALLSVVMFWICFATTRERVTPPPGQKPDVRAELRDLLRNRPWQWLLLAAIFSLTFIFMRDSTTVFYFKYVVRDDGAPVLFGFFDRFAIFTSVGMACQMLGAACLGFFARVLDKRTAAVALTVVTALAYGAFYFVPPGAFGLLVALNALASFAMGPTSALTWAMYADVADYGEWRFGRRATGLVYSASLFAIKTGTVAAGWLAPMFLQLFGFVRNAEQTPRALLGILLAFSVVPMVFALLKAGMIWLYPLRKADVERIERELAARRAAMGSGS